MKVRDVAFFISIQGILLGGAFLLSSGEVEIKSPQSQTSEAVRIQSWIQNHAPGQTVAKPMNMPGARSYQQVRQADSVAVTLERARQQRTWVF